MPALLRIAALLHRDRPAGLWIRLLGAAAGLLLLQPEAAPKPLIDAVITARQMARAGDHAGAAETYRAAYALQPWEPAHLSAAIEAGRQTREPDPVLNDLEQLEAVRPLNAGELALRGTLLEQKGLTAEAITAWEQARGLGLMDPVILGHLAELHAAAGEWDQAARAQDQAARAAGSDAGHYFQLGLYLALDRPAEAELVLGRAAALDPALAERIAPLRESLQGRPGQPPDLAYAQLGVLYLSLEQLPLAEEALARAVAYNPAYAEPLAYLAYVRARMGRPALGAAQQAAALAPDNPTVLYLNGLTWKQLDRPAQARLAFEQAYALDPANPAFAVEIASTHRAEGALEWADIWMQEAVRLAPDNPRFRLLLVQFYIDEEYRIQEAGLPLAQELAQAIPDSAEARDALAWAYYLTGDLDRAQAELDEAMRRDPTLARAYTHMGQLMERRGRLSEALWYYLKAAELEPQGRFGAMARRAIERLEGDS